MSSGPRPKMPDFKHFMMTLGVIFISTLIVAIILTTMWVVDVEKSVQQSTVMQMVALATGAFSVFLGKFTGGEQKKDDKPAPDDGHKTPK